MTIITPDWVKTAVFYQIFPDSFARVIPPYQQWLLQTPVEAWEAPPHFQKYKGGNLWGILEKLDYLQELGITAIYLTPIFQSASNHRYHTHDYYQVDPLLGGNEAFQALIEAIHQRGMKLVLDGVFNHASRGFFFFNDILENGGNSPWLDWFKIEQFPLAPYDGDRPANYKAWIDYRALPEFNHEYPAVREYIMQVGEYWLNQGIDGWRLDVPGCITAEGFWQEFRTRMKEINPEAYIVGEIWGNAQQWLDGSQFDGVMNYRFTEATVAFVGGSRVNLDYIHHSEYYPAPAITAEDYGAKIEALLQLYPWQIQLTQLNLLNSHDTARLLTVVGEDFSTVELSALLLFTFPGAPSIYYGDEVGLAGGLDPDCRRSFPPAQDWNRDYLELYRRLIAIRQTHPSLASGSYQSLFAEGTLYVLARIFKTEITIVAVNVGEETQTTAPIDYAQIPFPSETLSSSGLKQQYGEGKSQWHEDHFQLTLPPRQGLILSHRAS